MNPMICIEKMRYIDILKCIVTVSYAKSLYIILICSIRMIGLPKQKNNAKLGRTWHDKPWSFAQVIEAFLQCVHLTALWPRIPHSTKASKKLKLKNLNSVSVLVTKFQGQALNSSVTKKKHVRYSQKKLLPGKLTCPLKINGWKIDFLLKQSLSRGTCFSSCSGFFPTAQQSQ